jgi:O-antigen ligase
MIERIRPAVVPFYLLLCLLLGGSAQGVWTNAILQLLAIAILAWAALTREPVGLPAAGRGLMVLASLALLLFAMQLIPLPPALWTALPGRDFVAANYRLLEMSQPWLPLSLAPYDTLATALTLLPPLAVAVGLLRLGAFREEWLAAALVGGAFVSTVVGVLQVTTGDPSWYFYRFYNVGKAVGAFANSNHMAALLLVTVPFVTALAAQHWIRLRSTNARSLIIALTIAAAAVLGMGIVVNESLAILLLGIPVAVASAIMLMRLTPELLRRGLALIAVLVIAGAVAMAVLVKDSRAAGQSVSVTARAEIWDKTLDAAGDHWLTGTGIGTFQPIYGRYEERATITPTFVNHAHNDYLEIALEAGIPGALLLLAFLTWWGRAAASIWTSSNPAYYAKAASIASATLLLHSVVDFPLRTASMAAVMAMCLSLMAGARGAKAEERDGELRPVRHVTL